MIPRAYVTEWRQQAPWPTDEQVEQDLVITRALVEMYDEEEVRRSFAFRGGTAMAKLHLATAHRYSEDIDLVQLNAEPIGQTLDALRSVLDPWLGPPSWKQTHARVKLVYRLSLGRGSTSQRKLKLEINTREHEPVLALASRPLSVECRWFQGRAEVTTYELDELLATKLRALYQRKKGRDLFDLATFLELDQVDPDRVIECFIRYLGRDGRRVSRVQFEANLAQKIKDADFQADVRALVADGTGFDEAAAAQRIREHLISRLS